MIIIPQKKVSDYDCDKVKKKNIFGMAMKKKNITENWL